MLAKSDNFTEVGLKELELGKGPVVVSSSINKNDTGRLTQDGGINLESLNSSVKVSSPVSGQGLGIDFENYIGLTVKMISRRQIKPEDKMLSFAK